MKVKIFGICFAVFMLGVFILAFFVFSDNIKQHNQEYRKEQIKDSLETEFYKKQLDKQKP